MPVQYTMPPDTRSAGPPGTPDPPNDVNAHTRALNAAGAGINVLNAAFAGGADPTGAADSSAAFNAACAAVMIIRVPAGTYKLGSTVGPFTTGQFVICDPGVTFSWTGTGDCFRWADTSTYNTRTTRGGGILGWPVIDGTSDGAGSAGLHAGDILGFRCQAIIQNFTKAGDIGAHLDNQFAWTEEAALDLILQNCTQHLVFDVSGATTSTSSFGYGTFAVQILAKQNQDGVVLQNGAVVYNPARFDILGNFQGTPGANTSAAVRITGTVPAGHPNAGGFSAIRNGKFSCDAECTSGTGSNAPQTIVFGTLGSNAIVGSTGVLDFSMGTLAFAASNWTATGAAGSFIYTGSIAGDFNLNNATVGLGQGRTVSLQGPVSYSKSLLATSGNLQVDNGDFFQLTLTANTTVNFNPGGAATYGAAQRKTIIIKQAAAGGPFTVTWPHTGSPTTSAPTVNWVGAAPTMTATASAVDVYRLDTYDGATWYGSASQNVS